MKEKFWEGLERLIAGNELVIDRPGGTVHPRYPEMQYPIDYGYLKGTCGGDGAELDVFLGSGDVGDVVGIVCCVDQVKKDSELKVLLGCNEQEMQVVKEFLNNCEYMAAMIVKR